MILATWYKRALKDSLLGRVYADRSKIMGVESADKNIKQEVYEQYLAAFKKGVYNIIKEVDSPTGDDMIPRKYFSGGALMGADFSKKPTPASALPETTPNLAVVSVDARVLESSG